MSEQNRFCPDLFVVEMNTIFKLVRKILFIVSSTKIYCISYNYVCISSIHTRMEDLDRNLSSAVPMPGGVIIGKYCDISNLVEHPVPVYPPTHRRQHQAIPVILTKKVRIVRAS